MATEKRLVDAYSVIKQIDNYYNNSPFSHPGTTWLRGLELATGLLLAETTVDAVEVVRCKDCKHRYFNDCYDRFCCAKRANGFEDIVDEDEFCSRGERKEK